MCCLLTCAQNKHDSVVDKTSALHTECETLLRDKNELEALANKIESHLQVRGRVTLSKNTRENAY